MHVCIMDTPCVADTASFGLFSRLLCCVCILQVVDDLRPQTKAYGEEYMYTPNMDKLAHEGIMFTHVCAVCALMGERLIQHT